MSILINDLNFDYVNDVAKKSIIFNSFTLEIQTGKITSIVGASGSGKSTLLKLIAGLVFPQKGQITIDGKSPEKYRKEGHIGAVFQTPDLLPWRNVLDNVKLADELKSIPFDSILAERLLADVGLKEHYLKLPSQLSGGMQQRVSIVRALVSKPKLLILDEPFSQLDELLRFDLLLFLQRFVEEFEISVVMVTHDINEAVFASDEVIILSSKASIPWKRQYVNIPKPRGYETLDSREFNNIVSKVRIDLKEAAPKINEIKTSSN